MIARSEIRPGPARYYIAEKRSWPGNSHLEIMTGRPRFLFWFGPPGGRPGADAARAGPPAVAPVSTQSPHVHQTAYTAARSPEGAVAVPRTRTSPARRGSGHPRSATAVAEPRADRPSSTGRGAGGPSIAWV